MNRLGAVQQFVERKLEERPDLVAGPVMAYAGIRGIRQTGHGLVHRMLPHQETVFRDQGYWLGGQPYEDINSPQRRKEREELNSKILEDFAIFAPLR